MSESKKELAFCRLKQLMDEYRARRRMAGHTDNTDDYAEFIESMAEQLLEDGPEMLLSILRASRFAARAAPWRELEPVLAVWEYGLMILMHPEVLGEENVNFSRMDSFPDEEEGREQ